MRRDGFGFRPGVLTLQLAESQNRKYACCGAARFPWRFPDDHARARGASPPSVYPRPPPASQPPASLRHQTTRAGADRDEPPPLPRGRA